jgi:hypothetical protein
MPAETSLVSDPPLRPSPEVVRVVSPRRLAPGAVSDARAERLAALWKSRWGHPKPKQVQAVLEEVGPADPPRACIACYGEIEIPKVGDARFEPEIITPTRLLKKQQIVFMPFAFALVAFWVLDILHLLPWGLSLRGHYGGFGYVFAMGLGGFIAWIWRGAVRPTYFRLAPGIVQMLEYRYSRSKPTIRSYPMEAGTLVVVVGKGHRVSMTFRRFDQQDRLPLAEMRHSKQTAQRAWEALLSTAPTPPLSDEELVG